MAKKARKKRKKAKAKKKRKPNPAFMKPLTPSSALAEVVGAKPLPRTQAVKKVWAYIKRKGLQDRVNKRMINVDEKLAGFCGRKPQVSMFDLAKLINRHLS